MKQLATLRVLSFTEHPLIVHIVIHIVKVLEIDLTAACQLQRPEQLEVQDLEFIIGDK